MPSETLQVGKPRQSPLPIKTMAILCTVIVSEPISLTVLFPFIYYMVRDFGYKQDDIGYYVGWIASSFSFAQFFTAYLWGCLSDKIGRRPVLLIGLIGNSISTCLFGLSKTLVWAILSRSICGVLNGNIGIAKCVLGEITDSTNQAAAFSLIGLNYGLGSIIGPALGGLLSHPCDTIPWLVGSDNAFLREYPYFLPCFVSSLISTLGFGVGYFFLPETCKNLKRGYQPVSDNDCEEADEEDVEIPNGREVFDEENVPTGLLINEVVRADSDSLQTQTSEPNSIGSWSSADSISTSLSDNSTGLGMESIAAALAYAMLAFESIIFTEVFPIWSVVALKFNSKDVGILFSIIGVVCILCQIILYPLASQYYSPLALFKYPLYGMVIVFAIMPMIPPYLVDNPLLHEYLWPAVIIMMSIRAILENFSFTSVMLLVTNSAKKGNLGLANGLAQGTSSLMRAIGPALGGSMWAWSCQNGLQFPLDRTFIFGFEIATILVLCFQVWIMIERRMD